MGRVVRDLFEHFIRAPGDLGDGARGRIEHDGLERATTDYIAGMTDRYALRMHAALCPSG